MMAKQNTRGKTILLVDDDASVRATIGLFFKRAGFAVTTAKDAAEARACLAADHHDLLLLDLVLPGMGGLDLIVAIRQTHAALPVVILTGHASLTTAVEALRLGVRDYVFKPVHLEQLLGRIEDILHERDAERRQREILAELKSLVGRWEALETECQTQFTDQTPTATDHLLQRGPFRLDLLARRATIDGRALNITATSFDYLATLALHAPDAIAPEVLLWESQGYTESHLRAHEMVRWRIHSLRRAVETEPSNPRFILTVRGVGYRLAV